MKIKIVVVPASEPGSVTEALDLIALALVRSQANRAVDGGAPQSVYRVVQWNAEVRS